jgi:hypothetical protein
MVRERIQADFESVETDAVNDTVFYARSDRWTDVQSTIDDAPPGATIQLEARDYPFDFLNESKVSVRTPGLTIRGSGWRSRVFLEDGTTAPGEGASLLGVPTRGVSLQNFQIDGNWHNNEPGVQGSVEDGHNIAVYGDDFSAFNLWTRRSTGDGLEILQNATDWRVVGCLFEDNWEHSLGLNGAKSGVCAASHFDREQNGGHVSTWNGSPNPDTEGCKIIGCTFRGGSSNTLNIQSGAGKTTDITVRDCDIYDEGRHPVIVRPGVGGNPVENVSLSDLRIYGDGSETWPAIRATEGVDVTVENVSVDTWGSTGISIGNPTHVRVRDCTLIDVNQDSTSNDDAVKITAGSSEDTAVLDGVVVRTRPGTSRTPHHGITTGGSSSLSAGSKVLNCEVGDTQFGAYGAFRPIPHTSGNRPALAQDLTSIPPTEDGQRAWHDGSGSDNSAGPAIVVEGSWRSTLTGWEID